MDWDAFFVSWSIVAMLILLESNLQVLSCHWKLVAIFLILSFFIGPQGSVLIM